MKYYIWVDGEEHGPYEFEQLYESWRDGSAPQGFLWRREDQKTFAMPQALDDELARLKEKTKPSEEAKASGDDLGARVGGRQYIDDIRRRSNYPITRGILKCASWLAYVLIVISIFAWGYELITNFRNAIIFSSLGMVCFIFGISLRLIYEFGMMIADHTDVQIDIGRGLAERGSE